MQPSDLVSKARAAERNGHEATLKDAGNGNNIALLQTQQTSVPRRQTRLPTFPPSNELTLDWLWQPPPTPALKPLSLTTAADWSQTQRSCLAK